MNRLLFEYSYSLRKERRNKILFFVSYFLIIFIAVNLIIHFLVFPVRQVSESMTPDVKKNDIVMVTPLSKTPSRGDVILVKPQNEEEKSFFDKTLNIFEAFFTAQQLFYTENDDVPGTRMQLRRVVGMPGDTIYMRDYVLYVKEKDSKHFFTEFELCKNPYNVTFYVPPAEWDSSIGVKGSFDEITLGENEYFVLGDNRKSSVDSRLWGPLSQNKIKAKALFCYYPFKSLKLY